MLLHWPGYITASEPLDYKYEAAEHDQFYPVSAAYLDKSISFIHVPYEGSIQAHPNAVSLRPSLAF